LSQRFKGLKIHRKAVLCDTVNISVLVKGMEVEIFKLFPKDICRTELAQR